MKHSVKRRWAACLIAVALAGVGSTLSLQNLALAADAPKPIRETKPLLEKTLEARVYVTDSNQQGGSVLTLIDKGGHFDAIVFGEVARGKWMAGSDFFRRTHQDQAIWPLETAGSNTLVQLAITYRGDRVTLFRNGKEYAGYSIDQQQAFGDDAMVLLGLRYLSASDETGFFTGSMEEARIYDQALSAEQIAALQTNQPSDPRPLAWWTFEDGKAEDLMKTFAASRLEGNARVTDGKLVLDGSSYLWAARDAKLLTTEVVEESFDNSVQALFYKARSKRTGNMWDTWLYFHAGKFYLYYLANTQGRKWDNISLATSPDGVHWTEIGRVLTRAKGVTWMGSGSVYKSPNFDKDGKFFMNFSEWKGPRQTIFFAESKDLMHWTRLGNEYEFVPDERWYEKNGRWDCIWTLPRPGGGLYGYWSASPKAETGGVFGFGETLDGITWKALPPPKTPGVEVAEVGAIEKIGEKYYMIYRGCELILMADRPEGPFLPDRKSYPLMLHYFSRFFPTPDGVLFNHHIFDRPGRVYFAPLKSTLLDADGTLRLGWWKGNEKLKEHAVAVKPPALGDGERPEVVLIEPGFDLRPGLVLEGTLKLPASKDAKPVGLFIPLRDGVGEAVRIQAGGVTEFGSMRADGSGFKVHSDGPPDIFGSGEKVKVRGYRDWPFGATVRFRLLLKGSLMEFYLDDLLMRSISLPQEATGHIGLLPAGDPAAVTALKAWQTGQLQPAAKDEEPETPPQDDVYSRAAPGTYTIPPELKNFRVMSSTPLQISNAEEAGYDIKKWQSDPSRIIYHDGKYHVWMIDGYLCYHEIKERPENGLSWIRYLTSEDGKTWQSVGFVPLGPKGSAYDLAIEQANVIIHEGRFYLFSEGLTTNREKYKSMHAGIICLTADAPEGPWKQVGDLMLSPANDGRSFDSMAVVNPCHVFFQGKWFMYYKGDRGKAGVPTRNGVAIADALTGPYKKYENNPLLFGHGHFAWRYKHGIIMMNFSWDRKVETWILWTEDGLHFVPLTEGEGTFAYGSLYVPYDPLFGKPVSEQPTTEYWGLETLVNSGATGIDVGRIEWKFGSDSAPEKEKIQ